MGYIMYSRMKFREQSAYCRIQYLRGIAFIPSAIKSDGRMVTDSFDHIFGVIHKHFRVVWVWAISRVCQPEVLPNHNSMTVASFEKFIVTGLSYPVSYHSKVHIGVISHSCIVFP